MKLVFFPCDKEAIEVTLSIIQLEVVRLVQCDSKQQVLFLHIGRFQQKEAVTVGISKILVGYQNLSFCSKPSWS